MGSVQELDHEHFRDFAEALRTSADGFAMDGLYKKRTGSDKHDGVATFWSRQHWELTDHREVAMFRYPQLSAQLGTAAPAPASAPASASASRPASAGDAAAATDAGAATAAGGGASGPAVRPPPRR